MTPNSPKDASKLEATVEKWTVPLGNLFVSLFHRIALFGIGAATVWSAAVAFMGMMSKGSASIEDLLFNQKPMIIVSTLNPTDLEKVAEMARTEGHHVTVRGGQAHIEGPHDWAPVLNKKAFDAGITLAQLTPTLPNLEETFFEMTGGR